MKKLIGALLLIVMMAAMFAGCSDEKNTTDVNNVEEMPVVINTAEYTLYQNIFYNEMGSDYDGTEVTKQGTFATLYDAYNDVARYYVWGYNDETKCCDWQWEIKFDSEQDTHPSNGSFVTVKGEFVKDEAALDNYWIIHPEVTVQTEYQGTGCEIDMASMSGTLERVEIQNISFKPEYFEGKTASVYGRVLTPTALQHPYYDNAWEFAVNGKEELPGFGTMVLASGTLKEGTLTDAVYSETTQY